MPTQSTLRTFLVAIVFALTATISRGDSEIVIAIRYLQAQGNKSFASLLVS